ncbi:MAG: deoxyribonuclease IV [Patescibacteria group bacterium]|nr:deoxyribonuclease IV [Patescibacteria group bacterium]
MYFGTHVSISPRLDKAPENAAAIGAECFQCFSQSPRGGKRKIPNDEIIKKFKANIKKFNIKASYLHAPYFINLASKNNRIYHGSISAIRKDLEIASALGAKGVVVHVGSAKDYVKPGDKSIPLVAQKQAVRALKEILKNYQGKAEILLENAAGAGNIIGANLDQLAFFLKEVKAVGGICFDTAHAFESGMDLRTKEKVREALDQIEQKIGVDKLKLIHLNDSKTKLGSNSDRHEHLGLGEIGIEAFIALVKDSRLKKLNFILETPTLEGMVKDLEFLKGIRAE